MLWLRLDRKTIFKLTHYREFIGLTRHRKGRLIMGGYFKPLRRKIGVVTLVLACVLMVGWVRCNFVSDLFCIQSSQTRTQVVLSHGGRLFWVGRLASEFEQFHSVIPQGSDPVALIKDARNRSCLCFQFVKGNLRGDSTQPVECWITPYYAVVVPFTLLSAWLLLSKPRVAKPKA